MQTFLTILIIIHNHEFFHPIHTFFLQWNSFQRKFFSHWSWYINALIFFHSFFLLSKNLVLLFVCNHAIVIGHNIHIMNFNNRQLNFIEQNEYYIIISHIIVHCVCIILNYYTYGLICFNFEEKFLPTIHIIFFWLFHTCIIHKIVSKF